MIEHRITRRTLLAGAGAVAVGVASMRSIAAQSPSWRSVAPTGAAPAPRWDHTLVADSISNSLLLIGGRDNDGNALGDTWRFDITTESWTRIETPGPSARFGATASTSGDGTLLLFGGQAGSMFFNDTWRFNVAAGEWTMEHDGSVEAPAPRYGLGSALLPNGPLLVSHGFTFEGRFDDTWRFDPVTRTWNVFDLAEPRPLNRCLHEMISVPLSKVLLYGGCSSGFGPFPQGDAWILDPETGVWIDATPAFGPAARSNPSLVWSDTVEGAVLFGGQTESGKASDLWIGSLDGNVLTWSEVQNISDGPSPRSSHDASILGDHMYLFGGLTEAGASADLWTLTL